MRVNHEEVSNSLLPFPLFKQLITEGSVIEGQPLKNTTYCNPFLLTVTYSQDIQIIVVNKWLSRQRLSC
jgi:hypothetical protein